MAEALVTTMSHGRFQGYSAGSNPGGIVNPFAIEKVIDQDKMDEATEEQNRHRETLSLVAKRFDEVEIFVREE